MSSTVAQIFEHSSRPEPRGKSDPYLLLLRSLDVHTSDIAPVAVKIRELYTLAENMDYRLMPLLLKDVRGYVEALVALTSVNGKGLKYLTTQTQAYHLIEKGPVQKKMSMREMIEGQQQKQEAGVPYPE